MVKRRMCRASAPTLANGMRFRQRVTASTRQGEIHRLARLSKKRQQSRSTGALEAGNSQKLMPGFQGTQEKNRIGCFAPVSELPF